MPIPKFTTIKSSAVPLDIENVDTDQIIPARFLKATERKGFGDNLFRDWRYNSKNEPIENFPLNNKKFSGNILIAGKNFGCGSSREHAAWAIYDYGFRVVISSEFADIFKGNALNIGLLPITVSPKFLDLIFKSIKNNPNFLIEINLKNQSVTIESGESENFEINSFKKDCLLNGYDNVDYLVSIIPEIEKYESSIK